MPNQRKRGKKQVAVWLTIEELAALRALAKKHKKTMSEVLKEKIDDHLRHSKT